MWLCSGGGRAVLAEPGVLAGRGPCLVTGCEPSIPLLLHARRDFPSPLETPVPSWGCCGRASGWDGTLTHAWAAGANTGLTPTVPAWDGEKTRPVRDCGDPALPSRHAVSAGSQDGAFNVVWSVVLIKC